MTMKSLAKKATRQWWVLPELVHKYFLPFAEQIGVEIVDDLDMQRESLLRTRDRVSKRISQGRFSVEKNFFALIS